MKKFQLFNNYIDRRLVILADKYLILIIIFERVNIVHWKGVGYRRSTLSYVKHEKLILNIKKL